MGIRLSDAEYNIMEILWEGKEMKAAEIVRSAQEKYDWKQNTIYTFIIRLVAKGAIRKTDPNYTCIPLVTKDEVQRSESETLIDKLYGGSVHLLVKSFMENGKISEEDMKELRKIVENNGKG
jgi:BlaI family penicillinase repressor